MSRFKLPLERGLLLTRDLLNCFSSIRRPNKPHLPVKIRNISYQQEVLLIGVSIANENEEHVYIKVHLGYLMIACSVDTDESYLSRYAYYALDQLINSGKYFNFERFYWPDFFNAASGKSKYLDIINDRNGLDIFLKPKYSPFFKPGQQLYYPSNKSQRISRAMPPPAAANLISKQEISIGYCLADSYLRSIHSNHWPFLVPYTFLPIKSGEKIKNFLGFVIEKADLPVLNYSAAQIALNGLSKQMMSLAPIVSASGSNAESENEQIHYKNLSKRDELFLLWQEALPALQTQQFTHHMESQGMINVKGKPMKMYMNACTFSAEIPKLGFSWRDKGEYFELKLLFKVKNKVLTPALLNTAFFINSSDDPMRFYLLDNLQDFYVMGLFNKYQNCMSVFKCQYEEHFKSFKEQLEKVYELL